VAIDYPIGIDLISTEHLTTHVAGPAEITAALHIWQLANTARGKSADQERIDRVQAKLTDPAALVMVVANDADIVGMALVEHGRDGAGQSLLELCHISMLFVHPDYWGKRIGQVLLDAVAEHAAQRGHTELQLWTGQRNHAAQRLYRRAGFQTAGRKRLLDTGEPIIHLIRPISTLAAHTPQQVDPSRIAVLRRVPATAATHGSSSMRT
jgi:GNAT superfamily N-acetyltransferase